ncbi:MAG: GtrA family protein [Clostridia bacterium]|nr:GtrA family protein [Clostridia bacterium]
MEETKERQEGAETPVKQTKKQLFWEIFRFLLVGGTATLVDYFVFWLFDGLLLPLIPVAGGWWSTFSLVVATALGFCVGLVVNWLLSVSFVFKDVKNKAEASSKKSFMVFTIIGVIGLVITEVGIVLLVAILPEFSLFGVTEILHTSWAKWLAKVVMTCIVLVWNYVGRKLFIFK